MYPGADMVIVLLGSEHPHVRSVVDVYAPACHMPVYLSLPVVCTKIVYISVCHVMCAPVSVVCVRRVYNTSQHVTPALLTLCSGRQVLSKFGKQEDLNPNMKLC